MNINPSQPSADKIPPEDGRSKAGNEKKLAEMQAEQAKKREQDLAFTKQVEAENTEAACATVDLAGDLLGMIPVAGPIIQTGCKIGTGIARSVSKARAGDTSGAVQEGGAALKEGIKEAQREGEAPESQKKTSKPRQDMSLKAVDTRGDGNGSLMANVK